MHEWRESYLELIASGRWGHWFQRVPRQMAHWRQVQSTNCKVLIGRWGGLDLELKLRGMRKTERSERGEFLLTTCISLRLWILYLSVQYAQPRHTVVQAGIHKHAHVDAEAPLKLVSLRLPWAVAFIAQGIGGDVNKVVDGGEITLLEKNKVRKPIHKEVKVNRDKQWKHTQSHASLYRLI